MFAVVKFTESEDIAVVPESWLFNRDDTLMCRWVPDNMSDAACLNAVKNKTPVSDCWPAFAATVLRKESTYAAANRKLVKALDTSDLSTADEDVERVKRRERCHRRIESDGTFTDAEPPRRSHKSAVQTCKKPRSIELPAVPSTLQASAYEGGRSQSCDDVRELSEIEPTINNTAQSQGDVSVLLGSTSRPSSAAVLPPAAVTAAPVHEIPTPKALSTVTCVRGHVATPPTSEEPVRQIRPMALVSKTPFTVRSESASISSPATVGRGSNSPVNQQQVTVDSSLLHVLIQQQVELKEQLRLHSRYLQEILNRQKGQDDVRAGKLPACIKLPLKSYDDIMQLEHSLMTDSNQKQLVNHLALIGGSDVKDCVNRLLSVVLEHGLSLQLTWCGRNTDKHSFEPLQLKNVIIEATRKNPMTRKATTSEIEETIKTWLRNAPDRQGGRAERARRAAAKRQSTTNRQLEARRDDVSMQPRAILQRQRSRSRSPASSTEESD